jgi:hypothetical protein
MSVADLSKLIEKPSQPPQMALSQELKQQQQESQTAQAPLSIDTSCGPAQNNKPKRNKKKNPVAKSISTSSSFVADGSESLQSPTKAGASDSFSSKNSPTEVGTTDSKAESCFWDFGYKFNA